MGPSPRGSKSVHVIGWLLKRLLQFDGFTLNHLKETGENKINICEETIKVLKSHRQKQQQKTRHKP